MGKTFKDIVMAKAKVKSREKELQEELDKDEDKHLLDEPSED